MTTTTDTVVRDLFGTLHDGRPVHRYTLGTLEGVTLSILDYGAAVQQLWAPDVEGRRANVVLGGPDIAGYERQPGDYFGAIIGRYANRIAGAMLPVRRTVHPLVPNDGNNTLHGGPDGFHRRVWNVEHVDRSQLRLSLVSPDGDQGFPGELSVTVTYVVEGRDVRIDYRATTTAATAVNLTQHTHFNLGGEWSGSVGHHTLQITANSYTPVGDDLIPLGRHTHVADTPFDFRIPRVLDSARLARSRQVQLARGIDHNLVLSPARGRPAAVLADPQSGRTLELFTDQPGLQVYTGNFFDGSHVGTSGIRYEQAAGVALEPQAFPDSPHHAGEEGWPFELLQPGHEYTTTTRWRFGTSDSAL